MPVSIVKSTHIFKSRVFNSVIMDRYDPLYYTRYFGQIAQKKPPFNPHLHLALLTSGHKKVDTQLVGNKDEVNG